MKSCKSPGVDVIPSEEWKTFQQYPSYILQQSLYLQQRIDAWTEGCILPFPKKGDLGKVDNYRGITSLH